jgi:hypothetical protein
MLHTYIERSCIFSYYGAIEMVVFTLHYITYVQDTNDSSTTIFTRASLQIQRLAKVTFLPGLIHIHHLSLVSHYCTIGLLNSPLSVDFYILHVFIFYRKKSKIGYVLLRKSWGYFAFICIVDLAVYSHHWISVSTQGLWNSQQCIGLKVNQLQLDLFTYG